MAFIMIVVLVRLLSTGMLFYLVVQQMDDKSLLYTEMELKESTLFLLISMAEDVISIMGLSSSVLINSQRTFAEQGI